MLKYGGSILDVLYGNSKELAQSERVLVKTSLDHKAMNLRDLIGILARFQCRKKVLVLQGCRTVYWVKIFAPKLEILSQE